MSAKQTPLLFLLIPAALYWGWTLFGGLEYRAFDNADAVLQMSQATPAVEALRNGSLWEWLTLSAQDETARPMFHALLSLGPLLGTGQGLTHHYAVSGIFTLLLVLAVITALWRQAGLQTAAWFTVLAASSNLMLEYTLAGGHNWIGQAFLWSAFLAWHRWFLCGILLAFSILSSYHMIPFASASLFFWCLIIFLKPSPLRGEAGRVAPGSFSPGTLRIPGGRVRGIYLLTGFLLPFLFLILLTGFSGYPAILLKNLGWAGGSAQKFPAGPLYFPDMLVSGESAIWLLILAAGTFGGVRTAWKDWRLDKTSGGSLRASWWLGIPLLTLLFFEFSGMLKLGRIYITLWPFILALASLGFATFFKKAHFSVLLCVLLLGLGWNRQATTREAFFASKNVAPPSLIAGFHFPYCYSPSEEQRNGLNPKNIFKDSKGSYYYLHDPRGRTINKRELRRMIQTGEERVFLSFYSTWEWRSFIEDYMPEIVPVKAIYASGLPYEEIAGVENTDFHRFSNEAIYHYTRTKQLPFPVKNRIYLGRDLLPFVQE